MLGVRIVVLVSEEDRELIAAQACDEVRTAHVGHEPVGCGTKRLISERVAMGVIDLLEAVEVG